MAKDIATQMAGILALASSEDSRLPLITDIVQHGIAPFLLVGFNGAEGEKTAYAFRGV